MERQKQLITFRKNHVQVAWTFMNIMNVIHHAVRFCTMTLKDNIMLHFPCDKPNVVYIGVCNWGEVRCMQKVIPLTLGKCIDGWPYNYFLFMVSLKMQIPFSVW
jgi:hypothetical protein